MGKKKTGSKYATDDKILANKERRLARHLRNHPHDAQSQSRKGKLAVQGGKTPTGRGQRVNRVIYVGGQYVKAFVNIGKRASTGDRISQWVSSINNSVFREMTSTTGRSKRALAA